VLFLSFPGTSCLPLFSHLSPSFLLPVRYFDILRSKHAASLCRSTTFSSGMHFVSKRPFFPIQTLLFLHSSPHSFILFKFYSQSEPFPSSPWRVPLVVNQIGPPRPFPLPFQCYSCIIILVYLHPPLLVNQIFNFFLWFGENSFFCFCLTLFFQKILLTLEPHAAKKKPYP